MFPLTPRYEHANMTVSGVGSAYFDHHNGWYSPKPDHDAFGVRVFDKHKFSAADAEQSQSIAVGNQGHDVALGPLLEVGPSAASSSSSSSGGLPPDATLVTESMVAGVKFDRP